MEQDSTYLEILGSPNRRAFLDGVGYWLSFDARGLYVPSSDDPVIRGFECHNELQLVLAEQRRADADRGWSTGYPNDALMQALGSKADARGCSNGLLGALTRATDDLD